jgi:hypothetical protein
MRNDRAPQSIDRLATAIRRVGIRRVAMAVAVMAVVVVVLFLILALVLVWGQTFRGWRFPT